MAAGPPSSELEDNLLHEAAFLEARALEIEKRIGTLKGLARGLEKPAEVAEEQAEQPEQAEKTEQAEQAGDVKIEDEDAEEQAGDVTVEGQEPSHPIASSGAYKRELAVQLRGIAADLKDPARRVHKQAQNPNLTAERLQKKRLS